MRVPEDLIVKVVIAGLSVTYFDPEDPFYDFQVSLEREQRTLFHERLYELFETKCNITKADVDCLRSEIANDYLRARDDRSKRLERQYAVTVFPGMKKADWDAMWSDIEEHLKALSSSEDDHLRSYIRSLRHDDMSKNIIANLLGIDRRLVYYYLESTEGT